MRAGVARVKFHVQWVKKENWKKEKKKGGGGGNTDEHIKSKAQNIETES